MYLSVDVYHSQDIDNDRTHCEHWVCDGSSPTCRQILKKKFYGDFLQKVTFRVIFTEVKIYLYHIRGIFRLSVPDAAWYESQDSLPDKRSSHSEDTSNYRHDDHDAPSNGVEVNAQFCIPFRIRPRDIDKVDLKL